MDVTLAGTGEAGDLTLIIFGAALLFGVLFFLLWFPAWRRRRVVEQREAEYMATYEEAYGSGNALASAEDSANEDSGAADAESPDIHASEQYASKDFEIDTP